MLRANSKRHRDKQIIDLTDENSTNTPIVINDEEDSVEQGNGDVVGQCSYCGTVLLDYDYYSGAIQDCFEADCKECICMLCYMGSDCVVGNITFYCKFHENSQRTANKIGVRAMKRVFDSKGGRLTQNMLQPPLEMLCATLEDVCNCEQCEELIKTGIDAYYLSRSKYMQSLPRIIQKERIERSKNNSEIRSPEKKKKKK